MGHNDPPSLTLSMRGWSEGWNHQKVRDCCSLQVGAQTDSVMLAVWKNNTIITLRDRLKCHPGSKNLLHEVFVFVQLKARKVRENKKIGVCMSKSLAIRCISGYTSIVYVSNVSCIIYHDTYHDIWQYQRQYFTLSSKIVTIWIIIHFSQI